MKILAVIPARGGSKRIPGKNIRTLGGKPLIVWTIETGRMVPEICDLLVSTDDPAIAIVARAAGALVPWLRPAELATDTATSAAVCLHALEWYEHEKGKVDGLLLLPPTSPFRSSTSVQRGIDLFSTCDRRPVLGVSPATSHPMWCFQIEGGALRPFMGVSGFHVRSQDLPRAYVVNGAFYLIAPDDLRKLQSFYADHMVPLVLETPAESLDIDDEWDWNLAEALLRSHRSQEETSQ